MPTSRARKGFKQRKQKNRKKLEEGRVSHETKMNAYMGKLIEQMNAQKEAQKEMKAEELEVTQDRGIVISNIEDAVIVEDEQSEFLVETSNDQSISE